MWQRIADALQWALALEEIPIALLMQPDEDAVPEVEMPTAPPVAQFRPTTFDQYIGQDRAKQLLRCYMDGTKARDRIFPHVLLSGEAGYGKTALARILANELGVGFAEVVASEIKTILGIQMKMMQINGGILFIDEIHGLDRDIAEMFYPMMTDFVYEGKPMRPFTLVGATTELGEILKDRRPFYDRFKIPIELEPYTLPQLAEIARQFHGNTFPTEPLPASVFEEIAANCRGTPRIAIRFVEATIYCGGQLQQVLNNFDIIKDGFTRRDLKLLEYLAKNERGVGLQGLAAFLNTSVENVLMQVEPYLLQHGLVIRAPRGRRISPEGVAKMKELQHV